MDIPHLLGGELLDPIHTDAHVVFTEPLASMWQSCQEFLSGCRRNCRRLILLIFLSLCFGRLQQCRQGPKATLHSLEGRRLLRVLGRRGAHPRRNFRRPSWSEWSEDASGVPQCDGALLQDVDDESPPAKLRGVTLRHMQSKGLVAGLKLDHIHQLLLALRLKVDGWNMMNEVAAQVVHGRFSSPSSICILRPKHRASKGIDEVWV
mmetsp:Transcript_99044/g.236340  ORF Transcript_99044/g.236340 Transcript_99044/m.236340 type:complete len:206 (-) Transcript_99044:235-852(-)